MRVASLRVASLRVASLRVCELRFCELRVCELRVCELRVCESASCESASLRVATLRVCELRVCDLRVYGGDLLPRKRSLKYNFVSLSSAEPYEFLVKLRNITWETNYVIVSQNALGMMGRRKLRKATVVRLWGRLYERRLT
jgi:hypothetical protein